MLHCSVSAQQHFLYTPGLDTASGTTWSCMAAISRHRYGTSACHSQPPISSYWQCWIAPRPCGRHAYQAPPVSASCLMDKTAALIKIAFFRSAPSSGEGFSAINKIHIRLQNSGNIVQPLKPDNPKNNPSHPATYALLLKQ